MGVVRRRLAVVLVLGLVACGFLIIENQGLSDSRPIQWQVVKRNGSDHYVEAEGGKLHHVLYDIDLPEGATIELQCRQRNGEWRCTTDTYGTRMAKLGGAFLAGLLLLGLVLSPEIRERYGR